MINLYGPYGTAIRPTKPISVLIPGNSAENPLRVQVSALPPVTAKPASDPGLTKFWNSLREMKLKRRVFKFDISPEFIPEKLKWLYIRKAYDDLFQIILE